MPKKDASRVRVPLNCLIAPVTKEAVTGIQNETKESQGEIVDRAILLLAYGEEIQKPVRLLAGRSAGTEELVETGVVSAEFLPTGQPEVKGTITVEEKDGKASATVNLVSDLDVIGPEISSGRGKAAVQAWKRGPRQKGDKSR